MGSSNIGRHLKRERPLLLCTSGAYGPGGRGPPPPWSAHELPSALRAGAIFENHPERPAFELRIVPFAQMLGDCLVVAGLDLASGLRGYGSFP